MQSAAARAVAVDAGKGTECVASWSAALCVWQLMERKDELKVLGGQNCEIWKTKGGGRTLINAPLDSLCGEPQVYRWRY